MKTLKAYRSYPIYFAVDLQNTETNQRFEENHCSWFVCRRLLNLTNLGVVIIMS